jgi:hypothetical protein
MALGSFCMTDFNPVISVFSTFFLFLLGLCGSVTSMCAIITVIRNFVPKYAPLILLILVTYMKLAFEWDESMRRGIFGRWEPTGYIFCSGFVSLGVNFVSAIMQRRVQQYVIVQMFTEKQDGCSLVFYLVVLAVFIFLQFILVKIFLLYFLGLGVMFYVMILNFVSVIVPVYTIYQAVMINIMKLKDMVQMPKFYHSGFYLSEAIKQRFYILMLFASMNICGVSMAYEELQ